MCLYSDVQSSRKEQAELLRYKDGSLPFRYLGTPICIIEVFRKKSILLPSPNHFVRFTPQTKYWLNLLPPMHTGLI